MTSYPYANGAYDICFECGVRYGAPKGVMGMWHGRCDLCGAKTGLANAQHDYGLSDTDVEAIKLGEWK